MLNCKRNLKRTRLLRDWKILVFVEISVNVGNMDIIVGVQTIWSANSSEKGIVCVLHISYKCPDDGPEYVLQVYWQ